MPPVRAALAPLHLNKDGTPEIDVNTMASSEPGVFLGGDIAGLSETTVESVNDGKTASWFIHKYIQASAAVTVLGGPGGDWCQQQRLLDVLARFPGAPRRQRSSRAQTAALLLRGGPRGPERGDVRRPLPQPVRPGLCAANHVLGHDPPRVRGECEAATGRSPGPGCSSATAVSSKSLAPCAFPRFRRAGASP